MGTALEEARERKRRSRTLRNNPTEPEIKLWQRLRNSQLSGFKFRRQAPIGPYFADLFCPSRGLVVEVDGDTHRPHRDAARDRFMTEQGFHTLRFGNADVMGNIEGVVAVIHRALLARPERWHATPGQPHPNPSPEGEGLKKALTDAAAALAAISDTPRLDSELLAAHALGITRDTLLLRHLDDPAPAAFDALVARRIAQEPVAYITGTRDFWTLTLAVGPGVLIPRPDSETLIEAAEAHFVGTPGPRTVLDLGTGSGALLLAALDRWPAATGVGIDASEVALGWAAGNAARLGLAGRTAFHIGGWDGDGRAHDLILCNPPYVETDAALPDEVARFEPASALFAGPDGLDDYRAIAPLLRAQLAPGGVACVEIGATQAGAAGALFAAAGLAVAVRRDLAARDRCLILTQK